MGTTTDEAVRYRKELGLGVFPVKNKKPRIRYWQRGGLKEEASIRKIFGKHLDDAQTGITTGQRIADGYLYVLDVDERNGGLEALAALPTLPETVTSRTKDGWHYWFKTSTPQPTVYHRNRLEMKGTGGFVVVPPAPGRRWIRNPFEFEIAECPGFLLPPPVSEKKKHEPLTFDVNTSTGELVLNLADPVAKILSAPKGDRHRTLLSQAGRVKVSVLRGHMTKEEARGHLLQAAVKTGLEEEDALRVIDYCLNRGIGENASTLVVTSRVTSRDLQVLGVVNDHFRVVAKHHGVDVADVRSDVLSTRYVARLAKLDHPPQAQRSIDRLVRVGLLWRNPKPKRLREGQRPCHRYRPTWMGLSVGSVKSD